jgi:hypothetical protein
VTAPPFAVPALGLPQSSPSVVCVLGFSSELVSVLSLVGSSSCDIGKILSCEV